MPVAHCVITPDCAERLDGARDLAAMWGAEAGKPDDELTVNLVVGVLQSGRDYPIVASLYLPSLWADDDVSALQTGLARALSRAFDVTADSVLVMTTILEPGHVVDAGREVRW